MSIRLNKVVKEFNIPFQYIAFIMKEYCHANVSSINESITDEQYKIIVDILSNGKLYETALAKYNYLKGETNSKETSDTYKHKTPFEKRAERQKSRSSKRKTANSGSWGKISNHKGTLHIIKVPFGGIK